jgi:hypothetical protein
MHTTHVLLDGSDVSCDRGVKHDKVVEDDEVVGVRLSHHALNLVLRGGVAHALEQGRELGAQDPVVIDVELAEQALHLLLAWGCELALLS